ncbi:hypothetical protein V1509DRAFT_432501 [Lipomyces kononenkoae]
MEFSFVIYTIMVIGLSVTASAALPNFSNLTDIQALYYMLECTEACDGKYNYTMHQNRELVIQPYEIRELNYSRGSSDLQLSFCTDVVGNRFAIVTSSNTEYEEDLVGSRPFDLSSYSQLVNNMPLLKSDVPGNQFVNGTLMMGTLNFSSGQEFTICTLVNTIMAVTAQIYKDLRRTLGISRPAAYSGML